MKKTDFLRSYVIAVSLASVGFLIILTGCRQRRGKQDSLIRKPNIVFLLTDDQRFSTIAAWGNHEVKTPSLDRLARAGFSFTHAHIMGGTSGAICMPSRAMLMTGKSLFHLEMKGATIPDDHIMIPELLREEGYKTFGTGKWHNGKQSFARCFSHGGKIFFGGMSDHLNVPYFDFDPTGLYPEENKKTGEKFSSELFVDEAIRFLEKEAGDSPFFMYVSFTAPHDPRMAPDTFELLYAGDKIGLPGNFLPEHPFDNGEMKIRDEKLAPWPRTPEIVKDHLAAYYAMITHTDHQIGRILDALEKNTKTENTIIIFASDNGLAIGQHGLLGKQNLYEHSVRVPLIISGPGIPGNEKSEALCYLNDVFPTICDLTGIRIPQGPEGQSLIQVIKGRKMSFRDEVFYAYRNLQRGIRTADNWKLIKYMVNNVETTQLFNLNKDPWEMENLAGDPACSVMLDELTDLLDHYMMVYDDPMDLKMRFWGKKEVYIPDRNTDHLGVGKNIRLNTRYSYKYTGGGDGALLDGKHGIPDLNDSAWQGYEGKDLDVIIDLREALTVNRIAIRFFQDAGSWIFMPESVEISISNDRRNFRKVCTAGHSVPQRTDERILHDFVCEINPEMTRYIRVKAKNFETFPEWHPGAGRKAWIFADEIVIE
ncbi:MAG: sulfatase-like hydrolase/transferase [Bacteroidales bacterium]|nr:MAG: sulfatase-like hydrolase/transferase [Bacteroidales bacterium]